MWICTHHSTHMCMCVHRLHVIWSSHYDWTLWSHFGLPGHLWRNKLLTFQRQSLKTDKSWSNAEVCGNNTTAKSKYPNWHLCSPFIFTREFLVHARTRTHTPTHTIHLLIMPFRILLFDYWINLCTEMEFWCTFNTFQWKLD
jgi:hypothetical protein